jgi:hypothetical protein
MPNDYEKRIAQLEKDLRDLTDEVYRNNFSASQDFQKKSRFNSGLRVPIGTATPATCEIGELFVVSTTGKLYVCSASNTWTIVGTQS